MAGPRATPDTPEPWRLCAVLGAGHAGRGERQGCKLLVQASARPGPRAVLAVPVELAGGPVGVLDSYRARPHLWDDSEMTAVQAFAGVLGNLLNALAAVQASGRLAEQLQYALEHRVRVEQAKGVLMSRHGLDEATAFARLRRTARSTDRRWMRSPARWSPRRWWTVGSKQATNPLAEP